ncbi:asparagine synthase-related protein [Alkalimonas amylolytica]|uniref:asparagine synthase (glutamine-hydrolyzing) n=1 Tax=Alkalimonas amylolytica TaxID=152573 RepID=A0A1H4CCZ1_ALKAM|nr:asparagine synthase-related protein [Alkalimonas amylolytica]SEA58200.1 Asparagine synthase [Alkalimonas amylolytica]
MKQSLIRVGKEHSIAVTDIVTKQMALHQKLQTPLLSIASTQELLQLNGNALLVLGTPLPAIEKVPESWQEAARILPQREGVFAAIFWDASASKLVVCSDILGLQPLYWQRSSSEVVFADCTRAFDGAHNPAGWGAFLALGYTFGPDTLTKGVSRVPAATVMVVEPDPVTVQSYSYWEFNYQRNSGTTEEVVETLEESVDLALRACPDQPHTLLLSGGYDSRLIAFLLEKRNVPLKAIIVSHADENLDLDGRSALAVARHLNIPYTLEVPDHAFFSSQAYLDYLEVSETLVPSLSLFISQVAQFVDASVLWEGLLPGKTLKASEDDFAEFQATKIKWHGHAIWRHAEMVFGKEHATEMWHAFESTWLKEKAKYSNDSDGTALFNYAHRTRNRYGLNPFKVFQQKSMVCMPGMSRDYLLATMAVDPLRKRGNAFYQEVYQQVAPAALKFPVVHGSKPHLLHSKRVTDHLFMGRLKAYNFLQKHPKLMKLFLLNPSQNKPLPSRYLTQPQLWQQQDAVVRPDFLAKLQKGEPVPEQAVQLLFYWRVWQWLRQKPLMDYFT